MSVKISFSNGDAYTEIALSMAKDEDALAIDSVRHIFEVLQDATNRLEQHLIEIENNYSRTKAALVADCVWSIIDNTRRFLLLLPLLRVSFPDSIQSSFLALKQFRDSYHHIDERITEFFAINTESLFGTISWRYREALSQKREYIYLLSTSIARAGPGIGPEFTIDDNSEFPNMVGVFDVQIRYVTKNIDRKKKITSHETSGIILDNISAMFNDFIPFFTTHLLGNLATYSLEHNIPINQLGKDAKPILVRAQASDDGRNLQIRKQS